MLWIEWVTYHRREQIWVCVDPVDVVLPLNQQVSNCNSRKYSRKQGRKEDYLRPLGPLETGRMRPKCPRPAPCLARSRLALTHRRRSLGMDGWRRWTLGGDIQP